MENYSVLMSVYYKEKPKYLREAMMSIYNQTLPTNDFVLVCDGPLNDELDSVIEEMQKLFGNILKVYRLKENSGLGNALNIGLKKCKNELVARMDSDDISRSDRCEKQIALFKSKNIVFCSGTISEFIDDPLISAGKRVLPTEDKEIRIFSRKRNPINHPCVMFKRSAVIDVGSYNEKYHLFEDYYLWIRLLMNGYKAENITDILLDMRTPSDMYKRRGGAKYALDMLRFHKWLLSIKWSNQIDYLTGAIPHALICVLPNIIRKKIYKGLRTND